MPFDFRIALIIFYHSWSFASSICNLNLKNGQKLNLSNCQKSSLQLLAITRSRVTWLLGLGTCRWAIKLILIMTIRSVRSTITRATNGQSTTTHKAPKEEEGATTILWERLAIWGGTLWALPVPWLSNLHKPFLHFLSYPPPGGLTCTLVVVPQCWIWHLCRPEGHNNGLLNSVRDRHTHHGHNILRYLLPNWSWVVCRLKDDNDPVSGDYWIFIIHFAVSAIADFVSQQQRPENPQVPGERLN